MKCALLVGINYRNTPNELDGCENDVDNIEIVLKDTLQFDSIIKMTELSKKSELVPNYNNILEQLDLIIDKCNKGEITQFVFHFSGHGTHIRDRNGDETDNQDECICALDDNITDDELYEKFKQFPSTCSVFCLMDCCHSGTILDLKYRYVKGNKNTIENKKSKINSDCNIVMLSGCKDNQYSADYDFSNIFYENDFQGAMTNAFIKTLEKSRYELTFFKLLKYIRRELRKNDFDQIPQITSNQRIKRTDVFITKKNNGPLFLIA
tara:strand:- start:89 stop:883 length:795 start_codon:yes stop_codon:yes gene_type:complete